MMRNLITLLNIPCLIIGRTDLGGFNHCLLTMNSLRQVGINVKGIVLNEHHLQNNTAIIQEQQASTVELIREWSTVPVYGPIEFIQMLGTNWLEGIRKIAGSPEIQRLAKHLSKTEQETD
jgi:dethiobiotin synthetase